MLLSDAQANVRSSVRSLLAKIKLSNSGGVHGTLRALYVAADKRRSEVRAVLATARRLAANHPLFAELVVEPALGLDARFLAAEASIHDVRYAVLMAFFTAASFARPQVLLLLPTHTASHCAAMTELYGPFFAMAPDQAEAAPGTMATPGEESPRVEPGVADEAGLVDWARIDGLLFDAGRIRQASRMLAEHATMLGAFERSKDPRTRTRARLTRVVINVYRAAVGAHGGLLGADSRNKGAGVAGSVRKRGQGNAAVQLRQRALELSHRFVGLSRSWRAWAAAVDLLADVCAAVASPQSLAASRKVAATAETLAAGTGQGAAFAQAVLEILGGGDDKVAAKLAGAASKLRLTPPPVDGRTVFRERTARLVHVTSGGEVVDRETVVDHRARLALRLGVVADILHLDNIDGLHVVARIPHAGLQWFPVAARDLAHRGRGLYRLNKTIAIANCPPSNEAVPVTIALAYVVRTRAASHVIRLASSDPSSGRDSVDVLVRATLS